ncbi:MAG: FGGY family carbohydrate kinase [Candidatus Hydrogenedentes bacterium]|nr:FGGY family carbohydrate kinase [Candidatus Hydrogenedentota bacterium]
MSLLGIDVGTTGCKACAFSVEGNLLASAYQEYDILRRQHGWSEMDVPRVWEKIKATIRAVASQTRKDPVRALAVSSLGEAMVPVTHDRRIVGPSLLNNDIRGEEFLGHLSARFDNARLYTINGNTLGNHYGLTKLLWLRAHQPQTFHSADKFLLWGSFVPFMLGADPVVDYSLANRTLLFDIAQQKWSPELLAGAGLEQAKLPDLAPSGTAIGHISTAAAEDLGLPRNVLLATGAHDQCAGALGCGAILPGRTMLGMGTYLCLVPVFTERQKPESMIPRGLNTEHHAVPGHFVTFIYNQGGVLFKWYRDTFAAAERDAARKTGDDVYAPLLAEMPPGPSTVTVLPHFTATGPPDFITDSCGIITGLHLDTSRGDILKGILEGAVFYLRECIQSLPPAIQVNEIRVVGGGAKSPQWIQLTADILGCPLLRPTLTEAGALGAAIMAGVASRAYTTFTQGVQASVRIQKSFEPAPQLKAPYHQRFAQYAQLWPHIKNYVNLPPHPQPPS